MYMLILLSFINLAGFTILPYLAAKSGKLDPYIPMPITHRLFIVLEAVLIDVIFGIPDGGLFYVYVFMGIVVFDLVIDFRALFGGSYRRPGVNPIKEWKNIRRMSFDPVHNFNWDALLRQDARILSDLAMFILIIALVAKAG